MFKVWDRVRIKKWTDWNSCWEMDWLIWVEATIESIGCRSSYWDWNLYNLKDFSKEWITGWYYNSTMFELVEPKKIVVHCPTEAEANQLMQAYERKGWKWLGWNKPTEWNNWEYCKEETCYSFKDEFWYCQKQVYLDKWYKVITFQEAMELLGEKVEKPTPINTKPFNPLLKKPMNTLRENIRNNFFKKEENKLATLVETVEEKVEAVNELWLKIWEFIDNITEAVDNLEDAVDDKDKKAIKQRKKQLQELEKKLDDTLMKQLIVVWKKVFKE